MTYDVSIHSTGTYRFLPAIAPYSSGVAAERGYDIVGLRFDAPPSVADGFARLDDELERRGLSPAALVGLELRSPVPFGFGAFDEFNEIYRDLLKERGLLEADVNPIARTNVVPVHGAPQEPVLLGAFIVQKAKGPGGSDFVVAGSGEVDGGLDPANIVARGDVSERGLGRKVAFVLDEMRARLAGLGHTPESPTLVNVYTAYEAAGLSAALVEGLPATGRCGFVRWLTRPPLVEVDFEMDCRRVSGWESL
jgi:hypothetical protein